MNAPGFYFCLCPDGFLARAHALELAGQVFGGDDAPPAEIRTFWGDEGLDAAFWDALTLQGFSAARRVIFLRAAQLLPAESWKKLSASLASPRAGILPVFFMESPWEKGEPRLPAHAAKLRCLEFAEKQGWVWKAPGLNARSLPRYVQREAAACGLTLDRESLELLCAGLAPDAAAVAAGLDMLALARQGSECAGPEIIRQFAGHNPDLIIFDFIRQLQSGDKAGVWQSLLREDDGGESLLFPLLALLTRESRQLWQAAVGDKVWFPPHVAQAKQTLARRLGKEKLAGLFHALMHAEWAVKSGRRHPRQALEELVASLTLVF